MKQLIRPSKTVADVLAILKAETSRREIIQDMDSISEILSQRENLYTNKVVDNKLFEIPRENLISARVDGKKIISYYDYRVVKKANGRIFYDEVILSAPNEICPYCTIKRVKTVDHFLPKAEYPSYSITPINLIPSCRDCNTDKLSSYPTTAENQTFHPYFDRVDTVCWIKAELKQSEPLSFQYNVMRPDIWDIVKFNRALSHFNAYNLNQLFSNEANRELRGMQNLLKGLFAKNSNLLKSHLEDTYVSCLNGLGVIDWKTLMYKELSSNEWFLNGGLGINYFN